MDINKLIAVITVIITLSIATERLVEIIKGFLPTWFEDKTDGNEPIPDSKAEAWKKAKVSLLALVCGIITAFLASPILAGIFKNLFPEGTSCKLNDIFGMGSLGVCGFDLSFNGFFLVIALGLLASGGSSFWNSILEYLLKIKDLKAAEVNRTMALNRIEIKKVRDIAIEKHSKSEPENN